MLEVTVNSYLADTPLLQTYAFTEKIQIPGSRSLTGNDSCYYGLSLLRRLNAIPRVSTMRIDCTKKIWMFISKLESCCQVWQRLWSKAGGEPRRKLYRVGGVREEGEERVEDLEEEWNTVNKRYRKRGLDRLLSLPPYPSPFPPPPKKKKLDRL